MSPITRPLGIVVLSESKTQCMLFLIRVLFEYFQHLDKSGCHCSCCIASCPILRSVLTTFYWPWSDGWGQAVETDWLLLYTTFGPWMISRAPLASPCGGSQVTCAALSLSLNIQTHSHMTVPRLSWSCKTSALRACHPPSFHYAHIHTRSHTLPSNTHTQSRI